jgi:hypothetical protein
MPRSWHLILPDQSGSFDANGGIYRFQINITGVDNTQNTNIPFRHSHMQTVPAVTAIPTGPALMVSLHFQINATGVDKIPKY